MTFSAVLQSTKSFKFHGGRNSERNTPPGVKHAGSFIVRCVSRVGNQLETQRELVMVADLKAVEDLEDGLRPGVAAPWHVDGKSGPRQVIFPADQATESQPRLCDLPHIGEGSVGVGIPSEKLKSVTEVLIEDDGHTFVLGQPQAFPGVHVPQADRVSTFSESCESRRAPNLTELEKVPFIEEGVNFHQSGAAVSVARAGSDIKKVGRAERKTEHRTVTGKRNGGVRRKAPVDERVVDICQPNGSDVIGRISATDENAEPPFEESLDPIEITDDLSPIVKGARGSDKCAHLRAKSRRRLIAYSFPVFESRDQAPGVFAASPDECPRRDDVDIVGRAGLGTLASDGLHREHGVGSAEPEPYRLIQFD